MGKKYVFTVGAVLRGDDACGPMLSKMMEQNPIEGWDHIDGEMTPEVLSSVERVYEAVKAEDFSGIQPA